MKKLNSNYKTLFDVLAQKEKVLEKKDEKTKKVFEVSQDLSFGPILKEWEKIIEPTVSKRNSSIKKSQILNASVDDKGNLMIDEKGGYKYKPDAMIKLEDEVEKIEKDFLKEIEKISEEKTFAYEPYKISSFVTLSQEELKKLKPFFT